MTLTPPPITVTTPTPPTEVPAQSASLSSPATGALHAEFRDLQASLLKAQRGECTLTLIELKDAVRRLGAIQHALQSTSATGPKRATKKKETAAAIPDPDDLVDLD